MTAGAFVFRQSTGSLLSTGEVKQLKGIEIANIPNPQQIAAAAGAAASAANA